MLGTRMLALVEPDLPHVDLILNLQVALGCLYPDGAGGGRDGGHEALQEFSVVFRRRQVLFRELRNFFRETVNLTAGLFNLIKVDLRVRSYVHGKPLRRDRALKSMPCMSMP